MTMRDELPSSRGPHADGHEPGRHLPYPSGWFCLARSRELAPGHVLTRRLMDEDIVLYRTRDGRPRAVHPYCPHLGAHLGAGGAVEGQNLVCPFHRFAFAPDGTCVGTPDGPPPRARLQHHTISERNGFLFAWYERMALHPPGKSPAPPRPGSFRQPPGARK
ncbi:Rieske (2Fe-2S) protein [Streptomyces europaeiscabiei]|uniref:Rieske (2Fe-2S) protein n=1 Tax=Streptomyces TaxID=1883 RepID=UPI000A3A818A|nr:MULTISPECIES: Rieske (2Fe-2S) protein [Streptomyces]MDX3636972.1 Rieske (2Fe-2S) protein [Streptomyces europaeiscabiei]MDX3652804.1 Rieske (2Fe-2S) protein [Streptomyces europaeiscabiei]